MTIDLDRFTSSAHASARFVAQRLLLKPLIWSLTRVTVEKDDALDALDGPFVVVANHSSHLDAPLVMGALPRRLARYLAAGAAADYFFDVWWRRGLTSLFFNAFPVDRSGSRARSVGTSKALLERGVPLLVFPEGTRSRSGEMGTFKVGAARLAQTSGVPCVPIAIVGAYAAMPRDTNWPVRGRPRVAVLLGAPMTAESGEAAEVFSARLAGEVRRLHAQYTSLPVPGPAPATIGIIPAPSTRTPSDPTPPTSQEDPA